MEQANMELLTMEQLFWLARCGEQIRQGNYWFEANFMDKDYDDEWFEALNVDTEA